MLTSTEFMSSIPALLQFALRDLVKRRLICIVSCPTIVQITVLFCHDPLACVAGVKSGGGRGGGKEKRSNGYL